MNINTDTWHYRLVSRFSEIGWVNNLCSYMRRLTGMLAIIFIGIPSVLFGMVNTIVMVVKGREFLDALLATVGNVFHMYGIVCTMFGMVAWLLTIGYLLVTLTLYIVGKISKSLEANDAWQARQYERAKKALHREPNIFIEWCKAVHDRICPLVTFVDEEKTE